LPHLSTTLIVREDIVKGVRATPRLPDDPKLRRHHDDDHRDSRITTEEHVSLQDERAAIDGRDSRVSG
jgi:hypothetical protein